MVPTDRGVAYVKDLKYVNRDLKQTIILDNNPNSYAVNYENGLPIKTWLDDLNDRELYNYIPILEYLSQVNNVQEVIPKIVTNNEIDYTKCNNLMKYNQKESFKNLKDLKEMKDLHLKDSLDKPSINIKIINHNFNNYIVKNEDNKLDLNNQKYNDNSEIIPSVKNMSTKGKYSVNFTSNNNNNLNSNIQLNPYNNNQDDKKNKTKSFRDSIGDSSISNLTSNNFFQQKSKINTMLKSNEGPVQLVDNIDKMRRIENIEKTERKEMVDKYEKLDRYMDNDKSINNNSNLNNNMNIGYKFDEERKNEKKSFLNNPIIGYTVNSSNDNKLNQDKKSNSQIIRPGTANSNLSKPQYQHNRDYSNNLYMQNNQPEKQESYKLNKKPSFDQKSIVGGLRMIDNDLIGNTSNTPIHMHSRTPSYTLNKNFDKNTLKMNNININTARDEKSSKEKRNLNNTIKSKNSKMELDINAKINSIYNNAMINIGDNYPKSVKQISVVKISSPNSNSTVLSGLVGNTNGTMKSDDSKSRLLKTQSNFF